MVSWVSKASCPPPARCSVSWAHVHCALSPVSAPCQVFCFVGSCPLRPRPPVRPLPGPLFPGLMSTAPCQPPARCSVSWAHVHCGVSPVSAPCRVFCLLGSCPLRPQPPVRPLPGPLFPRLTSTAPWAARSLCLLGSCPLRPEPPVRPLPGPLFPGLMSTAPPVSPLPGLLSPGLTSTAPSAPYLPLPGLLSPGLISPLSAPWVPGDFKRD